MLRYLKNIRLRKRFWIIIISAMIIFILMTILIEYLVSYPRLLDYERKEATKDLHRGLEAVNREIFHLKNLNRDWSSWDELYNFMKTRDRHFIKTNLNFESFVSGNINLICLINPETDKIYTGGYDLTNRTRLLPAFFKNNEAFKKNLLFFHENTPPDKQIKSGLIMTEHGIMIISLMPILTSKGQGPSRGYLIMGRILDKPGINRLAEQTSVSFKITDEHDKSLTPECASIVRKLARTQEKFSMCYSNDNIKLFSLYPDIFGNPVFLFSVDYSRTLKTEARKIARLNIIFILIGFIILLFTIAIVLEYSVIIPVHILNKQVISIITGDYNPDKKLKTSDELGILSAVIDDMALTIKRDTENMKLLNSELEMLSITDALTSVNNRRNFDDTIRLEWERACRAREYISLVMCDIDYFKKYNDCYGHQGGDDVLVKVAGSLKKCMRRMTDRVYRYGGEEFIIILPNSDTPDSVNIAEKLLRAVRDLRIRHAESDASDIVTISTGCASAVPPRGSSHSYLVSLTDKALYEAKHRGRNRICSARTSEDDSIEFAEYIIED